MINSRVVKLRKNTIGSVVLELTTVICGFILPRMILEYYGSEVNGLVSSITQFLSFISLMELGVGVVVQSNLYKPLANDDQQKINEIMTSANRFFKIIGRTLIAYVAVLVIFYPLLVKGAFSHVYTAMLIIAISVSSFAQYYFGIVDRIFLTSAQLGYIQYNARTLSLLFNTLCCCIFMKLGASIHVVKITTSIIFLLQPIFIRLYVNTHFHIKRNVDYVEEPIKQKWNGIAQHVAAVVLGQTDIVILTIMSTMENVSIYSVYLMVINGVKQICTSFTSGFEALMGEMWVKKEMKKLREFFGFLEWILHTGTVLFFGCTAILLVPFISVYTKGITDVDYIQPIFALLLTWAQAGICFRLPYVIMIYAAGRYKETQSNYIIAVVINIVISVLTVKEFGLVGVAIGTLVAMVYQTIWMACYCAKDILGISLVSFFKQTIVDGASVLIAWLVTSRISLNEITYMSWFVMAVKVFVIWSFIVIVINYIVYRDNTLVIKNKIIDKILHK